MLTQIFYKHYNILTAYRDNNLLLERTLGNHVDMGLVFAHSIDHLMNFFDFCQNYKA